MTASTSNIWYTRPAFAKSTIDPSINAVQVFGYASPADGGVASYARMKNAPSPVLAGHVQTADGAWWRLNSHGSVPVEAFGVLTSATDNTAAFNAAIAWLAAQGGGRLKFGVGTYPFAGTIAIAAGGIAIEGAGWFTSTLLFNGGNACDCITVTGSGNSSDIYGFELRDLQINAAAQTGGRALAFNWVANSLIRDVYITGAYNEIEWDAVNEAYVDSTTLEGVRGQWALYFHAAGDGSNRSDCLTLNNVVTQNACSGGDGMWWDGNASTVNGNNLAFLGARRGLWVMNTAESNTYFPKLGEFNNLVTDGMQMCGCQFDGGSTMQFTNSLIQNTSIAPSVGGSGTQGGADTYACIINPDASGSCTRDFQFDNCQFGNSAQGAVFCAGRDILFNNCTFAGGGKAASNVYDALTIAAPAQDIKVRGCKIYIYGGPTNWRYGYNVGAGTCRVEITDSTAYTAQTNAVSWASTDLASYCDAIVNSNQGGDRYARSFWSVPTALQPTNGMTLSAAQMLGGLTQLHGSPGACTITTPTAAQLVASLQSPFTLATVDWFCINSTSSAMTLNQGSGVTFGGNLATTNPGAFAVGPTTTRPFKLVFTNTTPGSEAVTVYG